MNSVFAGFNILLFSDLFYFVGNKVMIEDTEVIKYKKCSISILWGKEADSRLYVFLLVFIFASLAS